MIAVLWVLGVWAGSGITVGLVLLAAMRLNDKSETRTLVREIDRYLK